MSVVARSEWKTPSMIWSLVNTATVQHMLIYFTSLVADPAHLCGSCFAPFLNNSLTDTPNLKVLLTIRSGRRTSSLNWCSLKLVLCRF